MHLRERACKKGGDGEGGGRRRGAGSGPSSIAGAAVQGWRLGGRVDGDGSGEVKGLGGLVGPNVRLLPASPTVTWRSEPRRQPHGSRLHALEALLTGDGKGGREKEEDGQAGLGHASVAEDERADPRLQPRRCLAAPENACAPSPFVTR